VSLEPDFAPAIEAGPEERTAIRDEHEKLSRLITDLPEEERAVFILARVEGKPLQEVADVMGFSVRTAKYRLADALEHLTRRMATTEAV
jgi:RNA polymerase sigma-70 factor (ECF subfamily)